MFILFYLIFFLILCILRHSDCNLFIILLTIKGFFWGGAPFRPSLFYRFTFLRIKICPATWNLSISAKLWRTQSSKCLLQGFMTDCSLRKRIPGLKSIFISCQTWHWRLKPQTSLSHRFASLITEPNPCIIRGNVSKCCGSFKPGGPAFQPSLSIPNSNVPVQSKAQDTHTHT